MAKIKIATVKGKPIYIGNPTDLKNGEYYIGTNGDRFTGLFVKQNGSLKPVCNCKKEESKLEEVEILSNYHGKKEVVTPSEGCDGISKVVYRKPKLEEKNAVTITKNGVIEIKVGEGYDGLDDVTVIVNIPENQEA